MQVWGMGEEVYRGMIPIGVREETHDGLERASHYDPFLAVAYRPSLGTGEGGKLECHPSDPAPEPTCHQRGRCVRVVYTITHF